MNKPKAKPVPCIACGEAWDLGMNEDGLCFICVREMKFRMQLRKLTVRTGQYVVMLSSAGNIDFEQDPRKSLPGVPRRMIRVASLRAASDVCRLYIEHYELGGGNWTGGQVLDRSRAHVAQISYNGRAWKPGPFPQPEIPLESP